MKTSKISRADALTQVLRFEHHARFPQTEIDEDGNALPNPLIEELITAFQEASHTPEHARQLGDWLMRNGVPRGFDRMRDTASCPMPGDVHDAAESCVASTPIFKGIEKTPYDSCEGSLADNLTEADVERWRSMAEHGKTQAARGVAKAILEHHAEGLRGETGEEAKA
jgi:hypothetical protein